MSTGATVPASLVDGHCLGGAHAERKTREPACGRGGTSSGRTSGRSATGRRRPGGWRTWTVGTALGLRSAPQLAGFGGQSCFPSVAGRSTAERWYLATRPDRQGGEERTPTRRGRWTPRSPGPGGGRSAGPGVRCTRAGHCPPPHNGGGRSLRPRGAGASPESGSRDRVRSGRCGAGTACRCGGGGKCPALHRNPGSRPSHR